jgi:hypothetical protein
MHEEDFVVYRQNPLFFLQNVIFHKANIKKI